MRILGALILSFGLAACGGGSKPATEEPVGDDKTTTDPLPDDVPAGDECCCDYIEETGEGDNMSENQMFSMIPVADCEGMGQCTDDVACTTAE